MTKLANLLALAATGGLLATTASAKDFPEGSPEFETDYKKATAASKGSGKPMLVVFSASWCPPCQANKKKVYPSDPVKAYHDKFVWVYLDTDKKENQNVASEFGVRGIPHIQFVGADGKAIDKAVGGTSPDRFAAKLKSVLEKAAPEKAGA